MAIVRRRFMVTAAPVLTGIFSMHRLQRFKGQIVVTVTVTSEVTGAKKPVSVKLKHS